MLISGLHKKLKILTDILVQVFYDNNFFPAIFLFFFFWLDRLWPILYRFNGHNACFDEQNKFVCKCLCFEVEEDFFY